MKTIIILGAGGQIGSILLQQLKKISTFKVHGTSRSRKRGLLTFDPFHDDWSVLGKVDVLINCIGVIREDRYNSFKKIHIELSKIIISNRIVIGAPRIIQMSAQGASSTHPVPFLSTKGIADDDLLQFDDTYVIRPSVVCTHSTMVVKKLLLLKNFYNMSGGVLFLPKNFGKQKIQPVMPEDLVSIVYVMIQTKCPVRILDVPGPDPIPFDKLIGIMTKNSGKPCRIFEIPHAVVEPVVKYVFGILFPQWIDHQQYSLLFANIVSDTAHAQKYMRKPLQSTMTFWERELN